MCAPTTPPERRQLPPSRRRLSAGHTHCKAPDSLAAPGVRRAGAQSPSLPPLTLGDLPETGLWTHIPPLSSLCSNTRESSRRTERKGGLPTGRLTAGTRRLQLGRKGCANGVSRRAPHVGHPGTGKKKVKASQTPSRISTKSHWGQLAVMSSREKQLLSWGRGAHRKNTCELGAGRTGSDVRVHVHSGSSCEAALGLDGGNTE